MSGLTTKQRRRKLEECGAGAFGDAHGPKAMKAGRPRYPLVKQGCDLSCKAAHDAFKRARQQHERKIAKRILARAKRRGCPWAS
jgi:hypothetical protein